MCDSRDCFSYTNNAYLYFHRFAHLINVDFFEDLFNVFNNLIDSGVRRTDHLKPNINNSTGHVRYVKKVSQLYFIFCLLQNLGYRESLHCIKTAFVILMGQGEVLNIDPMRFYTHLYNSILSVHAGESFINTSTLPHSMMTPNLCILLQVTNSYSRQRFTNINWFVMTNFCDKDVN